MTGNSEGKFGRRDLFRFGAGTAGAAALGGGAAACTTAVTPVKPPTPTSVFSLGIASGLHSPTEVVLWTRLEPLISNFADADWEVATSPTFANVVASGTASTHAGSDFTIKVLVGGLSPDTSYWYRFTTPEETSPVGRARTTPLAGASVSNMKFAFASCQNYANGFYAAWRAIAAENVDAVLFLGDYIYESSTIQSLGIVREEPTEEAQNLVGYRQRYQLYKSDPDLQAAHAAHPFLPIWDDHEVHNDYSRAAFNVVPQRIAEAYQVWFEYQPVWPISGTRIYRDFRWGDLAHLCMLDGRQYRDPSSDRVAHHWPHRAGRR